MLYSWLLILAEETTKQPSGEPGWVGFLPLILIAVFFYLILIAPMKRQEKQRQAMAATLKKNDKIVNSGGIIGIVESVKEKENEVQANISRSEDFRPGMIAQAPCGR